MNYLVKKGIAQRVYFTILLFLAAVLWLPCRAAAPFGLLCHAASEGTEAEAETGTGANALTALVISDLHYTENPMAVDSVVPAVSYAVEFTDAVVSEVIDRKPDLFIMTGDNTNSGALSDMASLAEKLGKIRDAGIPVVLTTGNHDFNQSTAEQFEEIYFPLIDPVDRDPASLSYTVFFGDAVLLAMDDSSLTKGGEGRFSEETMQWLEERLQAYEGRPVWFLSHHNVLVGRKTDQYSSYRIQNKDLFDLLRKHQVMLILTGHLHSQTIVEEDGMYEIVSAMPLSGMHLMGCIRWDGSSLLYQADPLDLERYGEASFVQALREKEEKAALRQREAMADVIARMDYTKEEQEQILDRMFLFLQYYAEGTLASHADELKNDEATSRMIDALWDKNYGPWMSSLLEDPPMDSTHLEIQP